MLLWRGNLWIYVKKLTMWTCISGERAQGFSETKKKMIWESQSVCRDRVHTGYPKYWHGCLGLLLFIQKTLNLFQPEVKVKTCSPAWERGIFTSAPQTVFYITSLLSQSMNRLKCNSFSDGRKKGKNINLTSFEMKHQQVFIYIICCTRCLRWVGGFILTGGNGMGKDP